MDKRSLVLVLDDEAVVREFVEINLIRAGYRVLSATDGREALALVRQNSDIAVTVLEAVLPGSDGFAVCRKIREICPHMGILFLSARGQEMDKVNGFLAGADDYVTKPFSVTELMLRVAALERRVKSQTRERMPEDHLRFGEFDMDLRSRILFKAGKVVDLTQIEFSLMHCFLKQPGKALTRAEILREVWGREFVGDDKIVDVNVRRLRLKIEPDPQNPAHIMAVWGYGYRWNV